MGYPVPLRDLCAEENGVVKSMIDLPKGLTFRPLDPERPNDLPEIRGVDFTPYKQISNR